MWKDKPPTEKQLNFLKRYNVVTEGLTCGEASRIIGEIILTKQEVYAYSFPECPELNGAYDPD